MAAPRTFCCPHRSSSTASPPSCSSAWCLPSLCPPACPRLRGGARLQCARTPGRRISTVWGLRRSSPRTRPATARDTAPVGAPALPSTLLTTCPTTQGTVAWATLSPPTTVAAWPATPPAPCPRLTATCLCCTRRHLATTRWSPGESDHLHLLRDI